MSLWEDQLAGAKTMASAKTITTSGTSPVQIGPQQLGGLALEQLQEEFKKGYTEARKLDPEDSLMREVTDVLKNELARVSEENTLLRKRTHELEDLLLKAIDLAHKVMEKFSDGEQVSSKDQFPRVRADSAA